VAISLGNGATSSLSANRNVCSAPPRSMFDEPGHGTRRAYDAVGSDGGSKAAADELDFGCVDIAGAVLPPEATAIGVGTEIPPL
jgi:hypothetical protein